ncbi:MAG: hypothetical protein GX256_09690 [Fretibacterium sp.]|nr:hypothetical protein [Fretibacterium sp.]
MMSTKTFETFEDELDAIRLSLYEEVKNMTPEEEVAYIKAQVEPLYQEFGIRASDLKPDVVAQ